MTSVSARLDNRIFAMEYIFLAINQVDVIFEKKNIAILRDVYSQCSTTSDITFFNSVTFSLKKYDQIVLVKMSGKKERLNAN